MNSEYDTLSDLGARLKAYRIRRSLTPEEVAKKIGISRAAVYRYESGQPIRADILGKIAALLNVSLVSLLGVGVEYFSSALGFFERMRQLEARAEQLSVLFGPISYLLTTDSFDIILPDVLAESIPVDIQDREKILFEINKIIEVLKERKQAFKKRRPNIISLLSAGELEYFCKTGFVGCLSLEGIDINIDIKQRRQVALSEVNNIIQLLQEQPMGIQIGVLVDSVPGGSFQIFKQLNHSEVAVSPFKLGSFANVRIGVASISSSPESVKLHSQLAQNLWKHSLKGDEAVDYLIKKQTPY